MAQNNELTIHIETQDSDNRILDIDMTTSATSRITPHTGYSLHTLLPSTDPAELSKRLPLFCGEINLRMHPDGTKVTETNPANWTFNPATGIIAKV